MADKTISTTLTDVQKGEIYGVLSVGCDRQTAAGIAGCSLADIRDQMQGDSGFAAQVRRKEAYCEFHHMRGVQTAAKEGKQWRASIWWLECRAPERYAPRGPGVVVRRHLETFVTSLVELVQAEVHNLDDRARVTGKMLRRAADIGNLLRDLPSSWSISAATEEPELNDDDQLNKELSQSSDLHSPETGLDIGAETDGYGHTE